jgi:hypothetical protein
MAFVFSSVCHHMHSTVKTKIAVVVSVAGAHLGGHVAQLLDVGVHRRRSRLRH